MIASFVTSHLSISVGSTGGFTEELDVDVALIEDSAGKTFFVEEELLEEEASGSPDLMMPLVAVIAGGLLLGDVESMEASLGNALSVGLLDRSDRVVSLLAKGDDVDNDDKTSMDAEEINGEGESSCGVPKTVVLLDG